MKKKANGRRNKSGYKTRMLVNTILKKDQQTCEMMKGVGKNILKNIQ